MTVIDGEVYCDKCKKSFEGTYNVKLGNMMSFDLCGKCERELELIVIDFMHGVKE
jgi:NAD-dependent SIR2 family protein deacetylase